jgi:hypothetical protein
MCQYANEKNYEQNLHICLLAYLQILFCGQSRFRTYVLVREQIYSLSPLTTRPSAQNIPIKKKVQQNCTQIFIGNQTKIE